MPHSTLHDAIEALWRWQFDLDATNFTSVLYYLIHKADLSNRWAIRQSFPHEVAAWEMWTSAPDRDAFFKINGFTHTYKEVPHVDR